MKSLVTNIDYVLIALGIFMLPLFGIGLILLAIVAWKIGTKMERTANSKEEQIIEELSEDLWEEDNRETFKLEEYSDITLENGK